MSSTRARVRQPSGDVSQYDVSGHDCASYSTGCPSPADAIEPFSAGKIALINNGYFSNGVSGAAAGAYAALTATLATRDVAKLEQARAA